MKRNISIQLKAAFLLLVFAFNTVVGFACAVGINMGFNAPHHHDEEEAIETTVHHHHHAGGKAHQHHDKAVKHHHDSKENSEKGGCCNDKVVKFQNVDKNLTAKTIINAPAFVAITTTFFGIDLFNIKKPFPHKEIVRFFYPPPPDILIAIQRFQI